MNPSQKPSEKPISSIYRSIVQGIDHYVALAPGSIDSGMVLSPKSGLVQ